MSHRNTIRFLVSCLATLFAISSIYSQTPKGGNTTATEVKDTGRTRALVVGISNYQFIDKLQYADRDAVEFSNFLKTTHFWGVNKEDVTLLTNDKAKNGDITTQLILLAQTIKPGDRLLFYFSGHGDVETITQANNGFLLGSDTYSNNYFAGALGVNLLKDLFLTLTNNNVKVLLITDACRSGKLAGGLKGSGYFASSLTNMWNNEIKILSTQPGKLSYEDSKWGEGRGVFSYYLIKGLSGEADTSPKDSSVTLAELEQYIGMNVTRETKSEQQPIVEGPSKFTTILTRLNFDPPVQGSGKTGNAFTRKWIFPVDSCNFYYNEMSRVLKADKLDPENAENAVVYFRKMKTCSPDRTQLLTANSELLASLMNASQEIITNSFVGKTLVSEEAFKQGIRFLDLILQNNDLKLPEGHLLNLKRYLYVFGRATWNDFGDDNKLTTIIDSAIKDEADAAYLLCAKAAVELRRKKYNQAIELLDKALSKSPDWLYPKYLLGRCYASKKQYGKALEYYEEVLKKDSNYHTFECTKCILLEMAEFASKINQRDKAIYYHFKNIQLFPDHSAPYVSIFNMIYEKPDSVLTSKFAEVLSNNDSLLTNRGMLFSVKTQFQNIDPEEAGIDSLLSYARDNFDSSFCYNVLGVHYGTEKFRDEELAIENFLEAIRCDSTDVQNYQYLAEFYIEKNEYGNAVDLLEPVLTNFKAEDKAILQALLLESLLNYNKPQKALPHLKSLVEAGYLDCSYARKLKKYFKGVVAYDDFIKNCKDVKVLEE